MMQALQGGGRADTILSAPKPRTNTPAYDSFASKTLGAP
jgi:hypothetical protein